MTSTPIRERIPALDALRGVAVAGILFANVLVFFGLMFLSPERAAAFPTAAADTIARFLERVLVEGKFYSIFSLLFGIGFGLQLARGGEDALPRFRRRLRILLGIGAVHAVFIWAGDILMLYALLGFTMPWFARKTDRELLRWTAILLAIPTALYLLVLGLWMLLGPATAIAPSAATMPAEILAVFEAVGTGGVREAIIGNLMMLLGRWADLFATARFPKVLGMFVLGLWTVRAGLALQPAAHRATLVRWSLLGVGVGLPANLIAAWALDRWPYLPPSSGGLLGVVMQGVGIPMLALGYAATVGLLVVDRRRLIGVFAPLGRMALTNYLMHSAICVALASGWGAGLWWRIGATRAMTIAAVIILVQIPLSAWWLSRFRFGPIEWVWRHLPTLARSERGCGVVDRAIVYQMRHCHAFRAAILLFLVACGGPADSRFESRVDSLFTANVPPGAPGCAVGIYRNGSVILAKGYGLASLAERRSITPATTFTLGSVSKQFTALAVLMLERDGRLSLDDDVRRYVPELLDYGTPIRIRDLLQHTSGIRDYGTLETLTGRHIVSMADFLDLIAGQRALNFTPQSRHGYSHSDYHLLAVVVERVAGEPFGRFLERTVLAPLGMTGSKVDDGGTTRVPERAYGYRVSPRDTTVQFPSQWLPGGSDLYTSVTDLARWDRNFDNATVGGRPLIDRMTTLPVLQNGDTIPYAFGIRHGTYRGLGILTRGSNSDGTRTEIVRFPAQRFTVAVLCNGSHLSPGLLGDRIADIFLEGQLQPVPPTKAAALPPAVPVTPAELERYAGMYRRDVAEPQGVTRIVVRDGKLTELIGDTLQTFTHLGDGRFSGDGSPDFGFRFPPVGAGERQKLQFIEGGEVTGTVERMEGPALWRPNAATLAEYAGGYFSEDVDAAWRVVSRGDNLVLRRRGAPDLTLVPVARDVFMQALGPWSNLLFVGIRFHRDAGGRITHLTVSTDTGEDEVHELRFDRYGPR